jgi:hypothetical protein
MNDESMLVLADHNRFRSFHSAMMNVIVNLIWRMIGRIAGVHFS